MAVFIHCNLKHITFTFELIRNIEIVKELVLLFFLCLIFCFVSLVIIFTLGRNNYMESDVDRITDNIVTPKAVGQGQHGTSRWLTNNEFKKNFKCIKIERPKQKSKFKIINKISSKLYLLKRKFIKKKSQKKKNKERVYYVDDNMHTLVVGATRSRKNKKCSFRKYRSFTDLQMNLL